MYIATMMSQHAVDEISRSVTHEPLRATSLGLQHYPAEPDDRILTLPIQATSRFWNAICRVSGLVSAFLYAGNTQSTLSG